MAKMCKCVELRGGHTGEESWHGKPTGRRYHRCDCRNCVESATKRNQERWQRIKPAPKQKSYDLERQVKICSKCGVEKPFSDYSPRTDGLACPVVSSCKDCNNTKTPEQRKAKRDWDKARYHNDIELRQKIIRKSSEYYYNNKNDPEFQKKQQAQAKKYKEENPEKLKETKSAWKKRNPQQSIKDYHKRRAILLGVPTDEDLSIATLRERDGDTCFYCGVVLDFTQYKRSKGEKMPLNQATHEHLIPLSKGGHNTFWNSTLACLSCNASKRDKTVEDYLHWLKDNT